MRRYSSTHIVRVRASSADFVSRLILFASLASLLAVAGTYSAHTETTSVKAAAKPGKEWKAYSTRTLADLPGQITAAVPEATSHYGGWAGGKLEATGFFRTAKIGDRWWLIDPDGCRFISKGMSSVNLTVTAEAEKAFNKKYGSGSNWVAQSLDLLREAGFNTLGAWSDHESFADAARRMPYTKLVNFMSAYGKMRGNNIVV